MKKIISMFIALALLTSSAFASVLGSSRITGYSVKVGAGTYYTENVFLSDQSGVGKQSEYYLEYSPNTSVIPIFTNGNYLFGKKTISNETNRLIQSGINLVGGINADFFSLQTGVPMSNLIVDGKIVTKDASGQDGIGITEDGTAFMSYAALASVLIKEDGSETNIYNINKYRQPYAIYMMTDKFSSETHNTTPGIDVILGSVKGEMRLGTQLEAVVESVSEYDGSIKIPEGKIVLTVDKNAPSEFLEPIASLKEGEKVKISFGVEGDERWYNVKLGMGGIGGKLLTNGEINQNLEKGAAPRTAIGIKEDGTLLLYAIDGRQEGHSYGVQLTTLAARMKELGCTEALNLDGGGSTSIVSLLPGDSVPTLKNSPSDGKERGVSTFVFLENKLSPTGEIGSLTFYPLNAYMLKGSKTQFTLKAADTSYYPMELPENIKISVDTEGAMSEITQDGIFTAKDDGTVRIRADYRGVEALMDINVLETPTEIKVKNASGEYINSLNTAPGESIQLYAEAFGGYNKLIAENNNFVWSIPESIGTVDQNGVLTINENANGSGTLTVSAGNKSLSIPVTSVSFSETADKGNYSQITVLKNGDGFKAEFFSENGAFVKAEGIRLYADGEKINYSYDEGEQKLLFSVPEETVRLTLYATNEKGCSSFYFKNLKVPVNTGVFADAKGHWAEDVLSYMYENGIISGENTDSGIIFRPQKEMNRAEFSVMMCNYLKLDTSLYDNVELPFSDLAEIPKWALGSVKALYKSGILTGKTLSDGTVCAAPKDSVTRAEAATIISRTLADGFFEESFSFSDIDTVPGWAKKGVNTLVSLGAMNGYTDGSLKPLNNLTKAEAAKLLYSIM